MIKKIIFFSHLKMRGSMFRAMQQLKSLFWLLLNREKEFSHGKYLCLFKEITLMHSRIIKQAEHYVLPSIIRVYIIIYIQMIQNF